MLPYGADGKAVPGSFRLGVSSGMAKHEGTQSVLWGADVLERLGADGKAANLARHVRTGEVTAPENRGTGSMVTVGEELDKAVQGAFTRPVPKSAGAQMRYLVRQHQGSTRRVAELLASARAPSNAM